MTAKLNVSINHLAALRQARRAPDPNLLAAAFACEQAGAHGVTIHLRGDRQHVQDADLHSLRTNLAAYLNVEIAANEEMVRIALNVKPDMVTLVPESASETTSEGGLDVVTNVAIVRAAVNRLREAGILTGVFVDPNDEQIEAAHSVGVQQIELCTSGYAGLTQHLRAGNSESSMRAVHELRRVRDAATYAGQYGLRVTAGHGLTYRNIGGMASIPEISEFNVGHSIVARSIFVGLAQAVREMLVAIREAA